MPLTRLIAITSLILLVSSGCAVPLQGAEDPDTFGGSYYVNGVDGLGKEYSGQLTITPTNAPDIVDMQWIITGVVQTGVGTIDGAVLTAAWETISPENGSTGTAVYHLQSDGSMVGERSLDDRDRVGTEEAFPVDLDA